MLVKNAPFCNFSIQSSDEYKTINWSGGTSTEVYIYPPTADFSTRDFGFRLSIATVVIEESTFSTLKDIHRILLLLEGAFTLSHKHHHTKSLQPFEQDQFEGDWETHCKGRGKDFNLLFKSPYKGSVEVITNDAVLLDTQHILIFSLENNSRIEEEELQKDDLLIIENLELKKLQKVALKGKFIVVKMNT
jgi:environmental stress-induced protein Ves